MVRIRRLLAACEEVRLPQGGILGGSVAFVKQSFAKVTPRAPHIGLRPGSQKGPGVGAIAPTGPWPNPLFNTARPSVAAAIMAGARTRVLY